MGKRTATADFQQAHQENLFIPIEDIEHLRAISGENNQILAHLSTSLGVEIKNTGSGLLITGDQDSIYTAENVVKSLLAVVQPGELITEETIAGLFHGNGNGTAKINTPKVTIAARKPIQSEFINTIKSHDVTFGVGAAGTGKTYLATMIACSALSKGLVKRIILCRPAVEAGEKLGFLPGDIAGKLDPYMRPFYDAIDEAFGAEQAKKLIEKKEIEIAPLAFLRGRSLKDSYMILDEAQNTTPEQMFMFLTRMDTGSKIIVTGDPVQCDLPIDRSTGLRMKSGLVDALELFAGNPKFGIVTCTGQDVVRHPMVEDMLRCFEARNALTAVPAAPVHANSSMARVNGAPAVDEAEPHLS